MKLLLSALFVTAVAASNPVRVAFDHGNTLTNGESCVGADWDLVTDALANARRRHLSQERRLQYNCNVLCDGYPPGTCSWYWDHCNGYRRLEGETDAATAVENAPMHRQLPSNACNPEISDINDALDNLTGVSTDCRTFLDAPRDMTCYEDPCLVRSFNLWNAYNQQVEEYDFQGGNVCESYLDKFTFEAVSDSCVDKVDLTLESNSYTKDRTENYEPYMLYSDNGSGYVYGQWAYSLPLEEYTLSAWADDNTNHVLEVTFTLDGSC